MSAMLGWSLALTAFAVGGYLYGWRGLALALTVVAFWLLLQFSRSLRVLRRAGANPVGHVPSAVMLVTQLSAGMTLMQVVSLTASLGRKLAEAPETWGWEDPGGAKAELVFEAAKLARWSVTRPD